MESLTIVSSTATGGSPAVASLEVRDVRTQSPYSIIVPASETFADPTSGSTL
jgi:hypothetical protein